MPYWERFNTQNRPTGPWWTLPCLGGDKIPALLCLTGDRILAMPCLTGDKTLDMTCLTGEKFSRYTMLDRRLNSNHAMLYRIYKKKKKKTSTHAILHRKQNSNYVMLDRRQSSSRSIPCLVGDKTLAMSCWTDKSLDSFHAGLHARNCRWSDGLMRQNPAPVSLNNSSNYLNKASRQIPFGGFQFHTVTEYTHFSISLLPLKRYEILVSVFIWRN